MFIYKVNKHNHIKDTLVILCDLGLNKYIEKYILGERYDKE